MQTLLITGANRGIGLELAKQYYQAGWVVIAASRHPEQIIKALAPLSSPQAGELITINVDVNYPEDHQKLVNLVKEQHLAIDILLNNAGVYGPAALKFGEIEANAWLEVFKINTVAPLLLAQTLVGSVAASKLKIIANMSSKMGSMQDNFSGGSYLYRASKAALNAVTKSMAIDLAVKRITVVALHPGWVQTDMGGEKAPTTTYQSVQGLRQVLSSLVVQDSGSFISYKGERLAW